MRYVISQILDKVSEILENELEESTQKDKMNQKENDLLYNYNLAKIMITKEAKAAKFTLKQ